MATEPTAISFRSLSHLVLNSEANAPEFIDLVTSFLRYMEPPEEGFNIVESGTYCGTTALCLAFILQQFGLQGHVHTADPDDWGATLRFKANHLEDYATYWKMDFLDMLPLVHGPIHMALIDCTGWDARQEHYAAVLPRMAPEGLIFIDDVDQLEEWSEGLRLRGHRGCAILQVE